MKAFIISLAGAEERRKAIRNSLQHIGIEYDFLDAVDGRSLSEEEIAEQCDMEVIKHFPEWLNRGAVGCALSHRNAYIEIINQDLPYGIILEDDVVLPENFSTLIAEIGKQIVEGEVMLLYYRSPQTLLLSNKNARHLGREYRILLPYNYANIPQSAVAYVISREACKSMLEVVLPIRATADSWGHYWGNHGIKKISVIYPRPVGHANFKSQINYLESSKPIVFSHFSNVVNDYKIPIIYQALQFRRKLKDLKMRKVKVIELESELNVPR